MAGNAVMDGLPETRLRELIDQQDIFAVLLRYARRLDRMDRELLRSCYWDDAIDDHHAYVGTPDYFIDTTFGGTSPLHIEHHGMSNHMCELDGDNAYCETHYTFMGTATRCRISCRSVAISTICSGVTVSGHSPTA